MKEVSFQQALDRKEDPVTVLPAKTVKIHKITSIAAFKNSGIDFSKLRKGMIFDGNIFVENKN
jgi:hypothetical protein